MTGARRTPLSNRSGAKCSFLAMAFWVVAPANRVPMTAQSDTDALEEEDNRNLVPDSCARACWHSVGHAVSKRKKLRPRLARPPHRGLEFMFEAQVFVQHGQGRFTKHGSVHAALAGLRDLSACRTRGFRSVPFTEYRAHALCLPPPMRRGASRRAGLQEICQCPTKCSSTRPIPRRPGWSFCAATASKNSTLNPRTASN